MSENDHSNSEPQPENTLTRRAFAAVPLAVASGLAGCAIAQPSQAVDAAPRTTALTVEDKLDIQDLFARYAWSYDCGDEEAFVACFLPDATVVGLGKFYEGREAIRGWYRYLIAMRIKEGDDWLHDAYHHRYMGDRRSCIVYSYATHFNSNPESKKMGVRSMGYFVNECVKLNDEWLFRRHSINRWDRQQLPWNKPLPWTKG